MSSYALRETLPEGFHISRRTFAQIEQFIADNRRSAVKVEYGIDLLVRGMVMTMKGIAQEKSAGPVASRKRSNPALAYRIPVQRITGRYFAGWTQRKVRNGHWVFYNNSVEAYLIEYGIYQRVRRPIVKMSLIGMLKYLQTTRTGDRFLQWVIAPRRDEAGRYQSFKKRIAATESIGTGGEYGDFYGGSSSGKGVKVQRDIMAGPKGHLP